jgi:DNA-binding NarL/FixJ family response regulator
MKRLRVLVADDHDNMRCSIVEFLCNDFQVVGAVCDGEELVLSASCLLPDVIVSDILMPRMDGLTARNKLIAQQRAIPFVFVSALEGVVPLVLNDPPAALVYKGEMVAHLSHAVAAVFTGRNYLSPYYGE